MTTSLRAKIGTLLLDRPRCAWVVLVPRLAKSLGWGWMDFHNRSESIQYSRTGHGIECQWEWSNDLNIAKVIPSIGARLFSLAFAEWPIEFQSSRLESNHQPEVSFVIGHRGAERLPHLRATVQTILSQRGVSTECIVVEQSVKPILDSESLPGVRVIHSPPPVSDFPYSRSWAFNVGVQQARGDIVVLHDNDILVPRDYAAELLKVVSPQTPVARLQRFIFYLSEPDSADVFRDGNCGGRITPAAIRQNCQGGTLAVQRSTYFEIGGHDETFIGWGGEDNEMFDRCQSVGCYSFGYLPFIHLYHEPQERPADERVFEHLKRRLAIPAQQRIADLTAQPFGQLSGPVHWDRIGHDS